MDLSRRRAAHLKAAKQKKPDNARARHVLNKYEGCSVRFRVLEVFDSRDEEVVRKAENKWLRKFLKEFGTDQVLNLRVVEVKTNYGLKFPGRVLTDEHKQILSAERKDYFLDAEARKSHSKSIKKLWKDPDYRQRVIDSRKAGLDDVRRSQLADAAKRMWAKNKDSEELRKKLSAARTAYWKRWREQRQSQ